LLVGVNGAPSLPRIGTDPASTMTAVSVTAGDRRISIALPRAGHYRELLHGEDDLAR
jgi:hypothetical protein